MKPQTPARGVTLLKDFGDAKSYRINCDCDTPEHEATLWLEVDDEMDPSVTMTLYSDLHTPWLSWTRWKYIWRLLTQGRVEVHQELILHPQTARNLVGVVEEFLDKHTTQEDEK